VKIRRFNKAKCKILHLGPDVDALHPDVEFLVQERHRPVGEHPEKGHRNDPQNGTPLL